MIYVKPINEITYDDVKNFIQKKIKENTFLDYKADFPRKLEKTIAAMANTHGGIIIIGVKEEDGKPDPDSEGILYLRGLEERVTQIILDRIYPPVFPEIQVCSPKNKKTFVIIRIAESDSTPHRVNEKTDIYLRTGNITRPERKAYPNEVEWLYKRREKATNLRKELYKRANERFSNLCNILNLQTESLPKLTFSSCPLFPSKALKSSEEINCYLFSEMINKIPSSIRPCPLNSKDLPIQDGLILYSYIINKINYMEINKFGLVFQKRELNVMNKKEIFLEDIFKYLLSFFEFINYFYKEIGYWGFIDFNLSIEKILNKHLSGYILGRNIISIDGFALEDELKWNRNISIPKLEERDFKIKFLIELCKEVSLSFGSSIDDNFETTLNKLTNIKNK